nr:DUF6344 domain-containing protein [Streptomyces sp. NBC_00857]
MAAFKVKKLWTVFITAFFAVLASLGLSTPAAAAGAAVHQPAEQPAPAPAAHQNAKSATARVPLPRSMPRDRSLPPTIKQRIRAEAHGSSPSVRHLPARPLNEADAPALREMRDVRESASAAGAASVAA